MKIANGEVGPIDIAAALPHVPSLKNESRWAAALDEMRSLSQGWDGYHAMPPTPQAIANAKLVLQAMVQEGLPPTRVAPSVVGGVGITRRIGPRKVYLEFCNDGHVDTLFTDGENPVAWTVDISPTGLNNLFAQMRSLLDG